MFAFGDLEHPIVQAPMAGGPSTPALAAAVSAAGGLGTVAAGYRPAAELAADLRAVRAATDRPLGANVFWPSGAPADPAEVERYAAALAGEAERAGAALGAPRSDDDAFRERIEVLLAERPDVVSFAFGCPSAGLVSELQAAGSAVWVTVTTAAEARTAHEAGADALVVQGVEAGGHRGSFDDAAPGDVGLLALLQLVRAVSDLPLVAAGGVMTGRGMAGALAAGAQAVQLGTVFLLCPEAGTAAAQRSVVGTGAPTGLTRAFTGRTARGIVNRFQREHSADAPRAYPEVHHLTAPLRAAATAANDADGINLWAGQAHGLTREEPAADLVRRLATEARAALREASRRED